MENNQNTKKPFWKDIKNIVILLLLILLIIVGVLFFRNCLNQNQIYDLQSQIQTLTTSNNELSSQIEGNSTKIAELENNNTILKNEKEALVTEKTTLETEIEQLKNNIATLNSQIASLKKSSNTNKTPTSTNTSNTTSPFEVGVWSSVVTTSEFSRETFTSKEVTYTTKYEFKSNGDFYVNDNKVGTYKDGSIFFKDSNDPNYRTASYNLNNNILYVNLYQDSANIVVSSNFYECKKN